MFTFFKRKEKSEAPEKLNIINVFSKEEETKTTVQKKSSMNATNSEKKNKQFEKVLTMAIVNLEQLKQLSWHGIPEAYRSKAWKILLKYMPTNRQTQESTIKRKRNDYFQMVETYIDNPTLERDANEKKTFKLINDDVVRTLPDSTLFRNERIQQVMRRVLYVWHMRHPASGYVQGINDVVTPFIIVFLSDLVKVNTDTLEDIKELADVPEEQLRGIEADSYWCLSKILDGILDNYTSSWPGIQKSYNRLLQVVKRVDAQLINHFTENNIDFYHMYFKWVTCLLLRQFTSRIGLRLYDTYLSDDNNYSNLCLFIMAAIILRYSKKIKSMGFEQIMKFQQNMPTRNWDEDDLSTTISQAFVYQGMFGN